MVEIDASGLADLGRGYLAKADALSEQLSAAMVAMRSQIEYAAVAEMKAVTPGSKGPEGLGASTLPISRVSGTTLDVDAVQTKTIHSRRLGDISLAALVIEGIKHPVQINPINPDGTLAFLWKGGPSGDGMYFFKHVQQKARAGDPYPERALPATTSAVDIIAARFGNEAIRFLMGVT